MKQEIIDKIENTFKENPALNIIKGKYLFNDGTESRILRFFYRNGKIYEFLKGSRRKGIRLYEGCGDSHIIGFKPIVANTKPIKDQWQNSLLKAKKLLNNSGLWKDTAKNIDIALSIGYENIREARNLYWRKQEGINYDEMQKLNMDAIKQIDSRLIENYTNPDGIISERVNTNIIWYLDDPLKIKKMNFGVLNEEKLKEIAQAMNFKQPIRIDGRTSYDVSFQYQPDHNKAWYSEEYKNCGNGHYYLALDSQYAMFYEDD